MRLIVLVPHRDARIPLRAWSGSLFAVSCYGAWSFPQVMPIAALSRPLPVDALKLMSTALRLEMNNSGGKITGAETAFSDFPSFSDGCETLKAFGLAANISLSGDFFKPAEKFLKYRFSPLVIAAALIDASFKTTSLAAKLTNPPETSFRAAALANMDI
ncbi:MAG: hypothetical protein FWH41_08625, partial [Treponema sp.]|nr:hypothetical protein [Treponema sp.]